MVDFAEAFLGPSKLGFVTATAVENVLAHLPGFLQVLPLGFEVSLDTSSFLIPVKVECPALEMLRYLRYQEGRHVSDAVCSLPSVMDEMSDLPSLGIRAAFPACVCDCSGGSIRCFPRHRLKGFEDSVWWWW